MAASTTSSSPLPNIVIHLIGPDDASALERQLWDQIYKHVNIPANAETSQSDIIGNHTTGNLNNIEMSPDSPTATLVDPNEPIPKWHVENNLAESVTPAIGHMPFAQGSTSAGGGGGFRQDSHGQYINPNHSVHYPRRGTATNVNVRFGAYTMIMGIDQAVPERLQQDYGEAIRKSKFRLLVDTGSNTTWLLGRDYMELSPGAVTSVTKDKHGQTIFDARPWPVADPRDGVTQWGTDRPFHEVLISAGFQIETNNTGHPVSLTATTPGLRSSGYELKYLCGDLRARIFLSERVEDVRIGQCYGWTPKLSKLIRVIFKFRFAAAAGVTFHLDRMPVDGILGLGLIDKQQGFGDLVDAPSFLNAIQRCVSGPRESLDSSAPCLYFALRTPGSTLKENWMAINNWPLTKVPRWSRKIAVIPSEGDSTKYDHWKVKLVGMAIVKKGANRQAETIPNGNLPISESAHDLSQCNVLLDTGSSLSYVPDRIIAHLRALFPCSENTTPSDQVMPAEAAAATTSGTSVTTNLTLPFVVPNSVQSSSKPLWIEYKFMGMTAGDTVTVYGPVDPFLCCRNPHIPKQRFKEGLLWPFSTIPNRQDSSFDMIFGLNFFHSMFVALHCGTTTTKPYVELDDQVQGSEMNEYKLPPVSEEE